jgi:hypothetical protein
MEKAGRPTEGGSLPLNCGFPNNASVSPAAERGFELVESRFLKSGRSNELYPPDVFAHFAQCHLNSPSSVH